MTQSRIHPHSIDDLPRAEIERNWKTWLIWLVPIGAVALAAWFIFSHLLSAGPTLHIYFDDAAGLQSGQSLLKYRGAEIGEVKTVKLTRDHRRVDVTVSLYKEGESVARSGSRFWIVKPEFGAAQISGLRTIVSGDYITVEPGGGPLRTTFDGLPSAPPIEPPQMLRIVLLAERAESLKERTPVFYRDIRVGEVFSLDLGGESQTIHVVVDIQPRYAPLVRMNSKFWRAGGIHASLSLSGLTISAESAQTLLSGGISFATPDTTENQAPRETNFRLYDKPEDAWLAWSPAIELKESTNAAMAATNSPE